MSQKWEPTPGKQPTELRVYQGQQFPLDRADRAFFQGMYDIPPAIASRCIRVDRDTSRYLLPIFGPTNAERGVVARKPWAGAPRACAIPSLPKADTYKHSREPLQSHYWSYGEPGECLVLVEDQLSAIKLAAYGYDSVALLGVPDVRYAGYSGADRITEVARRAKDRPVIVALDNDMTETAFLFAKKWRHAFVSLRVAILERDLKDTAPSQFLEVLGT